VLLYGVPESVEIDVIDKLLLTQVTARALSAAEIREKGLVFDKSSFQAYNFAAAFAIEDRKVPDPTGGMMASVAATIAYRAVRNRGTIGGSLAHADPAADWPTALTMLGGVVLVSGAKGRREVPVESFITGIFTTVLSPDELIVALRIPKRSPRARYGYWKFCRKAGEFANAIGAVLNDPETGESRAVLGALAGPPHLFKEQEPLDDAALVLEAAKIGEDAYSRRLHAVALKRAFAQIVQ
jgi:carbon-monoxide dehydrogenase medium subunit